MDDHFADIPQSANSMPGLFRRLHRGATPSSTRTQFTPQAGNEPYISPGNGCVPRSVFNAGASGLGQTWIKYCVVTFPPTRTYESTMNWAVPGISQIVYRLLLVDPHLTHGQLGRERHTPHTTFTLFASLWYLCYRV